MADAGKVAEQLVPELVENGALAVVLTGSYARGDATSASDLDLKRALTAAVQRDLLALRLASILAVHHRLLYGSENILWEQVGERMSEEWRRAQAAAFNTAGESLETSCAAALRLFRLATDSVAIAR